MSPCPKLFGGRPPLLIGSASAVPGASTPSSAPPETTAPPAMPAFLKKSRRVSPSPRGSPSPHRPSRESRRRRRLLEPKSVLLRTHVTSCVGCPLGPRYAGRERSHGSVRRSWFAARRAGRADHELVARASATRAARGRRRRPAGVPVATMSPGSSVISVERWATSSGIERSGRRSSPPACARR